MAAQRGLARFCLAIIGVPVVYAMIVGGGKSESGSTPAAATETACKSDWTKCGDTRDIANNWSGYDRVRSECKREANKLAKYGDPKWPWAFAFSTFHPDEKTIETGTITAIEKDAQFQNGFGAWGHVEVTCEYDLRQKKVLNVNTESR